MTLTIITTNTIVASGAAHTLAAEGDDLYVVGGAILASTSGNGVVASGANTSTVIDGTLFGRIHAYESVFGNSRLVVGTTGVVRSFNSDSGDAGVAIFGGNSSVINHGLISVPEAIALFMGGSAGEVQNSGTISGTTGIQIGFGSSSASVVNTGTIMGSGQFDAPLDAWEGRGIYVQGGNAHIENGATGVIGSTAVGGTGILADFAANGLVVNNLGLITAAQGHAIDLSTMIAGVTGGRINNFGTISGQSNSFIGSQNTDMLVNRGTLLGAVDAGLGNDTLDNRGGTIEGDVLLGDGADIFDNRGGVVNGTADGGAGADVFRGNADQAEVFDGGADADTLDFRFLSGAVGVALDGSFDNFGTAVGDVYTAFERVNGSGFGDVIWGNAQDNQLLGFSGDDTMDGGSRSDLLVGGQGTDLLTGGLGHDTFRFTGLGEIGDVITDFHNLAGDNDKFQIKASTFGGGLAVGALAASQFQSRADNAAQDANDRFIFRTTDRTLWFDADGNGAGAAVLVADLQAGATLTAVDIQLI